MTDLLFNSDTFVADNPFKDVRVKAALSSQLKTWEAKTALKALDEKRAQGWRPASREDWDNPTEVKHQSLFDRPPERQPVDLYPDGDVWHAFIHWWRACGILRSPEVEIANAMAEQPLILPPPPAPSPELLANLRRLQAERQRDPDSGRYPDPSPEDMERFKYEHPIVEAATVHRPLALSSGKAGPTMSTTDKTMHPRDAGHKVLRDQIYPAVVTKVAWHWNEALGEPDGYDLLLNGKTTVHFPGPEWRIEEALKRAIENKADKRDVNWWIEWNRPNGRANLISLKDNSVKAVTELNEAIDRDVIKPADDTPAKPKNRWAEFYGWFTPECARREIKPERAEELRDMLVLHISEGRTTSFTDLPDAVTNKQLIEAGKILLKKEHPLLPTKEQWKGWLTAHGYSGEYVLKALGSYEGMHLERLSDWGGELEDVLPVIAGYQAKLAANAAPTGGEPKADEAVNTLPDANNGHFPKVEGKTTDMPQSSKSGLQSVPETGNPEVIDKKDEIRAKYTVDMRGKDYLTVQGRVLLFRLEHPDWTLDTDVIAVTEMTAVFKATIKNADGRTIASGHGRATEAGTKNLGGRFVEKGETAAIGRALALCGYGTDDSLDDAEYPSDSPVERKIG